MTWRWRDIGLALVAVSFGMLLGIQRGESALPNTVNSAAPADTDPLSQGASQIRGVKVSLIDIFGLPNGSAIISAPFGIATDGRVNFPSGIANTTQHVTGYFKALSANAPSFVNLIPVADGGTGRNFTGTTGLFYWNNGTASTYAGTTCTTMIRVLSSAGVATCEPANPASRVVRSSGDVTTTSTTLVDVGDASIDMTTGARPVQLFFTSRIANSGAGSAISLNFSVDGVAQLGAQGPRAGSGANINTIGTITHQTAVLTAGTHTFRVQARVSADTGTIGADSDSNYSFSAFEIR